MAPTLAGLDAVPLAFEANLGQNGDSDVLYLAGGRDYQAFVTAGEVRVIPNATRPADVDAGEGQPGDSVRDVLRLQFTGANADVTFTTEEPLPGRSNYFRGGDEPVEVTDVPTYAKLVAHDVWSGIDVTYTGNQRDLRFDLDIHAGADIGQVSLTWAGAQSVSVDESGQLLITTPTGTLIQEAPVLYQDKAEKGQSRKRV